MKVFVLISFFYISLPSLSQEKFDKYAPAEGCPYNTLCSKEMGQIRKNWRGILTSHKKRSQKIQKFLKSQGTPINFYITSPLEKEESQKMLQWDSSCPNHNLKKAKISIGQKFINSFKELSKNSKLIVPTVIVEVSSKKSLSFPLSQGVFPSFLRKNRIFSVMSFEENYYTLSTSAKGDIKIHSNEINNRHPEQVQCPKSLIETLKSYQYPKNLTAGYYCRNIWDQTTQMFKPAIFSSFCK